MPLLQPGTYSCRVTSAAFVGDTTDGRCQLSVRFDDVDQPGEGITWFSSLGKLKGGGFSQDAFKFACDQLRALGWDAEENAYAFEPLGAEDSPLLGRVAEVVVVNEPYNGRDQIKVKWINDPNRPRGNVERMAPDQVKAFADKIRAAIKMPAPAASRPRPAPAVPPKTARDYANLPPAEKAALRKDLGEPAPYEDPPF